MENKKIYDFKKIFLLRSQLLSEDAFSKISAKDKKDIINFYYIFNWVLRCGSLEKIKNVVDIFNKNYEIKVEKNSLIAKSNLSDKVSEKIDKAVKADFKKRKDYQENENF